MAENPDKNWSREQLLIAFNLYCQMPFGKMHSRNPEIIRFAELIGRTPSSPFVLSPAVTQQVDQPLKYTERIHL